MSVINGLSTAESFLVLIKQKPQHIPAPTAAKVAKFISLNPGLITNNTPIKPAITATHLLGPTFSFNITKERIVATIGEINESVNASANEITEIA